MRFSLNKRRSGMSQPARRAVRVDYALPLESLHTGEWAEVMEVCGEPGRIRDDRSWLRTLCDKDAV